MRGLAVALLLVAALPARAADLPIFDAHVHYNALDWSAYDPQAILALLDRSGVRRAIVSGTPNQGTWRLRARAPGRIVPFARPYRSDADRGTWYADPAIVPYVESELASGIHYGIGEFHVHGDAVAGPTLKRLAELAAERNLYLFAHTDAAGAGRLLDLYPTARLLWAHAGMSASAAEVGALLDRAPRLVVELSLRYGDIAPGGTIAPAWRDLLVRHADRFLLGTDTWATSRWGDYEGLQRQARAWLAQLPPDVAERIAYRNGDRLFPPR